MPERTALVTGGTGGLGAAVVRRLLDDGWRVVVPWVEPRELERAPDHDDVALVQADLLDADSVAEAVATATGDGAPPLRAVVNLVGGFATGEKVEAMPVEDFERMLTLNLRPTYLVAQAAIPHLRAAGGGSIVCVSARPALRPFPGAAGYVTAKGAVLSLVGALDAEYRDEGIRTNAILPSVIDTPGNRAAMPDADTAKWVTPDEIAAVISFLVSDASAPTSGAHVPVYGRA